MAVVGAGVMGSSAAWRLARRGREVLLLEQFQLGHSNGSSHGPTRVFRFVYADPFYVSLAQRALRLWRELEKESGEYLLDITGGIDVGSHEALAPVAEALDQSGATYERIENVTSRFPGVRFEEPALFSPDTGIISASASVQAMTRLAVEGGAVFRDGSSARVNKINSDHVVLDIGGDLIAAKTCVVAAGAWVQSLLGGHLANVPVEVTREQIVYYAQLDEFPVVIDRRAGPKAPFALPSRFGAPGARFGHHMTGRRVSPEDSAKDDAEAVESITAFAAETIPAVKPEPVATETCLYTTSPDEDFIIDREDPLVIASPCSGHGFKFAPLIGEILARLALGEPPLVDLSRFRISRF